MKRVFWLALVLFATSLVLAAVLSGEYGVLVWLALPAGGFALVYLEDLVSRPRTGSTPPEESTPDHVQRYDDYVAPASSTHIIWPPPGPGE